MMKRIIMLLFVIVMMVLIAAVVVGDPLPAAGGFGKIGSPAPTPGASVPEGPLTHLVIWKTDQVPTGHQPIEYATDKQFDTWSAQGWTANNLEKQKADLTEKQVTWLIEAQKKYSELVISDISNPTTWTALKENLNEKGAGTVETITYSDDKTPQHYTRTEYAAQTADKKTVIISEHETWATPDKHSFDKEVRYKDGTQPLGTTRIEYDEKGKPLKTVVYDLSVPNNYYEYDYDKKTWTLKHSETELGGTVIPKVEVDETLPKGVKTLFAPHENEKLHYDLEHIFSAIRFYGTEYTGLGGWSSLFIDDKDLQKYRDTVQDYMCKSILFGGIDCWTSKICENFADVEPANGVLLTKSAGGEISGSAHIEATRSYPATFNNGTSGTGQVTEFVYTITYAIQNSKEDELQYNIVFFPRNYRAFRQNAILKQGESASIPLQQAIVQSSKNFYNQVCLVFTPAITSADGEEVTKVCNTICGGVFDSVTRECNPLETAQWQNNEPNGTNANNGRGGAGDFNDF